MLRNTTNFQNTAGSQSARVPGNQGSGADALRTKANFQEQNRHFNNESDISDEDMGDIDENVVHNENNQKNTKAQQSISSANGSQYKNQQNQKHNKSSENKNASNQGSGLKQPGFMSQTANKSSEKDKQLQMVSKLPPPQQQISNRTYETGGMLQTVNEEQSYDPEREADFDKAYNKLIKKFYQEQGPNLLIPDEDLHKVEQKGFDAGEVQRKIQENAKRKEEKIKMMQQIKEEKELEGCTFAPQMATKKKNPEKRDLNKFLEDQQKYLEMKEARQNERKEKLMQNQQSVMSQQPGMNEKSKKILEKKKKQQEQEPIQEDKEEEKKSNSLTRKQNKGNKIQGQAEVRKRMASPQPKETFQPQISKKSKEMAEQKRQGQKIEDHLIIEGKKTNEKLAKREQEDRNKQITKKTNKKSEQYIIQKFNREFEAVIQDMFSNMDQQQNEEQQEDQQQKPENLKALRVNYLRLKELLVNLGMINEQSANNDSAERALLYELWQLLRGEEKEEIQLEDVKMVIIAILRMDHKRIGVVHNVQQTESERQDPKNFGFYNEKDQFCLRTEDVPKIQKHYNIFYLNRLQHLGKLLEQQKARKAQEEEFNYKPQLNENTAQIAAKYRQKIAEQIKEEKISTFEWLAAQGNKEAWREHAKKIIDDEEMKECTFKPQRITEKTDMNKSALQSNLDKSTNASAQGKKYEELYALSKQQKVKQDKTKQDYEWERNKEELTFKPKLMTGNAPVRGEDNMQISQDKHVQKQLERLEKGREEKERIKMFTERGGLPPIKQGGGNQLNVSQMTASSKRPASNMNPSRKSPRDGKTGIGSGSQNAQSKKQLDAGNNIEYDKQGLNSMFDHGLVSPSKDGNDDMQSPDAKQRDIADKEKTPLLFVDVNLGGDNSERIVVFEGDTAQDLAKRFCEEHQLDDDTQEKLEELLQSQISSVLTKIEEEQEQESNVYSQGNNL